MIRLAASAADLAALDLQESAWMTPRHADEGGRGSPAKPKPSQMLREQQLDLGCQTPYAWGGLASGRLLSKQFFGKRRVTKCQVPTCL